MEKYLSVTTLTKYLKMKFDKDPYLERVYLTGQVSNFRKRPTHQYFSLKAVSYTHLTLPTKSDECRSRWSPYH